jgi:uncharacterized membrane protein
MTSSLFALTTDSAKSMALMVVLVFVGIAIVSALVIKAIVMKLLSLLVCAFISFGAFSQRSSITKCADSVKANAMSTGSQSTKCTFFGIKVNVPTDKIP